MKLIIARTIELLCFAVALAFLIPPISSNAQLHYRATPALIIGGLLFAISQFLSWRIAAQPWAIGAAKLLGYLVLVWIAYERASIL